MDRRDGPRRPHAAVSDTLAEITALAAQFTDKEPADIAPSARLYADLGLTGDDAHGLMAVFADQFKVDMSGFVWLRFFDDEGADFVGPALVLAARLISTRFDERWTAVLAAEREITLAHLAKVADRGAWFDPPPGPTRPRQSPLALPLSLLMLTATVFLALVGAIGCWGYFTGQLGGVNVLTAFGLAAMALLPLFLAWSNVRAIRGKLASA